jgi:hypothetical protein
VEPAHRATSAEPSRLHGTINTDSGCRLEIGITRRRTKDLG